MKKEYLSPEFEFNRIRIGSIICISGEDPLPDIHEVDEGDDA